MEYAVIENGIVVNFIWLHPLNAEEFPDAVPYGDLPLEIGDSYEDGVFYRNGEKVLTAYEEADMILNELMGGVEDVCKE